MTLLEELSSLVLRIQNLRARIDCAEDPDMALEEQAELRYLLEKLERLKQSRGCRIARIRVSIINNLQEGEECYAHTGQLRV